MIIINGKTIEFGNFPDGSMLFKYSPFTDDRYPEIVSIRWHYENDREFLGLIYLVKHLRSLGIEHMSLYMPYIPNARQDRVKTVEDVFTLKYFADLLNSLNFDSVTVLDPHSHVSEALINNLQVETPESYVKEVLNKIESDCWVKPLMFYPDEGAMKRYSGMVELPYAFGIKKRDWKTGKILGLDVAGDVEAIKGKDILIVDDICSRGGTFLHSAKKLKELGANKIYLSISHCENTILEGELLTSGLIEKVYTTDSIFTKSHEKVEVLR